MLAAVESGVVAAAAEVFWRSGYEDARIEDVVRASGANRYALYATFGGKRELFLAVLAAYQLKAKTIFFTELDNPNVAPLEAIRRVCRWAVDEMAARGAGCLIHNVGVECARNDEIIAARIHQYTQEFLSACELALSRARDRGELSPAISPKEGARHLLIVKYGLGDYARAGASKRELLAALDAALSLLKTGCAGRLERRATKA